MSGINAVEGGFDHGLALGADGKVWSWGKNENYGQLGVGAFTTGAQPPRRVCDVDQNFAGCDPLTGIKAISTQSRHNLALTDNGSVLAWGNNNEGQVGNNTTAHQSAPVVACEKGRAPCQSGVKAIAAATTTASRCSMTAGARSCRGGGTRRAGSATTPPPTAASRCSCSRTAPPGSPASPPSRAAGSTARPCWPTATS